jgi:hypothetical protein
MLARPSCLLLVHPWLLLMLLCLQQLLLMLLRLRLLLLVLLCLRLLLLLLPVASPLLLAHLPPWVHVPWHMVQRPSPPYITPDLRLGWRMSWPSFPWSMRPVPLVGGAQVWPLLHLLRLLWCLLFLLC